MDAINYINVLMILLSQKANQNPHFILAGNEQKRGISSPFCSSISSRISHNTASRPQKLRRRLIHFQLFPAQIQILIQLPIYII